MKRNELEHAVRAAGAIVGRAELLIIGSQALHASVPGSLPDAALRSVEVDIAVFDDAEGRIADLIDGSIGEGSMFHSTFGYYAQGVVAATAILPSGWRDRLVRFETPATNGVVGWCLEPHDLWVAKAIANRPKDVEFCDALLRAGLVERNRLAERLGAVDGIDSALRDLVEQRIAAAPR